MKPYWVIVFLACSRTTDQTMVRATELEQKSDEQTKATSEGGSKTEEQHGATVTTETESWDQLVFGDSPDAGLDDGGVPARPQVLVHHPATKVTVQAPWTREQETWLKQAVEGEKQTDLTGHEVERDEKKTSWDFLGSPLKWLGFGVLLAGVLFLLYKFRKFIPFLKLLPF